MLWASAVSFAIAACLYLALGRYPAHEGAAPAPSPA
jgi:hypothetical protein